MHVVIAPHPDDEVIGAHRLLEVGVDVVVYVAETDGVRTVEAINCARHYHFRPVFSHGLEGLEAYLLGLSEGDVVYTPSDSNHIMHQLVREVTELIGKKVNYQVKYYNVDVKNIDEIMDVFYLLYPSQIRWLKRLE